jgi:hypothetical protein
MHDVDGQVGATGLGHLCQARSSADDFVNLTGGVTEYERLMPQGVMAKNRPFFRHGSKLRLLG